MKKILSAIIACVLCASVAVAATGCGCQSSKKKATNSTSTSGPGYKVEPTEPSFKDGNFGYYILNDNEVKVTVYSGKEKNVTIPATVNGTKVKVIERSLFRNAEIESVTIPEGITEIQDYAFAGCQNLKEVVIPEGVTTIGDNAFWNCKSLEKVTIPSSLKKLGVYAFSATGLKSVTIPESKSFTSLSEFAFFQSFDLAEVVLPLTMTNIPDNAFKECSDNLTIKAYTGSYGVSFAKKNGYKLEEMQRAKGQ